MADFVRLALGGALLATAALPVAAAGSALASSPAPTPGWFAAQAIRPLRARAADRRPREGLRAQRNRYRDFIAPFRGALQRLE